MYILYTQTQVSSFNRQCMMQTATTPNLSILVQDSKGLASAIDSMVHFCKDINVGIHGENDQCLLKCILCNLNYVNRQKLFSDIFGPDVSCFVVFAHIFTHIFLHTYFLLENRHMQTGRLWTRCRKSALRRNVETQWEILEAHGSTSSSLSSATSKFLTDPPPHHHPQDPCLSIQQIATTQSRPFADSSTDHFFACMTPS